MAASFVDFADSFLFFYHVFVALIYQLKVRLIGLIGLILFYARKCPITIPDPIVLLAFG